MFFLYLWRFRQLSTKVGCLRPHFSGTYAGRFTPTLPGIYKLQASSFGKNMWALESLEYWSGETFEWWAIFLFLDAGSTFLIEELCVAKLIERCRRKGSQTSPNFKVGQFPTCSHLKVSPETNGTFGPQRLWSQAKPPAVGASGSWHLCRVLVASQHPPQRATAAGLGVTNEPRKVYLCYILEHNTIWKVDYGYWNWPKFIWIPVFDKKKHLRLYIKWSIGSIWFVVFTNAMFSAWPFFCCLLN